MKIKNRVIIDPDFIEGVNELITYPMPIKQCMEVSACVDELQDQTKVIDRARKAVAERYCKKDTDGKPILEENSVIFENDELRNKFIKDSAEILEQEFEISLKSKVKLKSSITMSPIKYRFLKDLIEIED